MELSNIFFFVQKTFSCMEREKERESSACFYVESAIGCDQKTTNFNASVRSVNTKVLYCKIGLNMFTFWASFFVRLIH